MLILHSERKGNVDCAEKKKPICLNPPFPPPEKRPDVEATQTLLGEKKMGATRGKGGEGHINMSSNPRVFYFIY